MRCNIKAFRLNADGSVDDVEVVVDDLIMDDMVGALIIHEVLNLMDDLARLEFDLLQDRIQDIAFDIVDQADQPDLPIIALGGDGSDMS